MKRLSIVIFALLFCVGFAYANKPFGVKNGIVTSTTKSSMKFMGVDMNSVTKSTMYFRDYGNEYVLTSETSENGGKSKKELMKYKDGVVYSVDFKQKKIMKMDILAMGASEQIDIEKLKENLRIKKVGNESILGYNCEVYEGEDMKIWSYKGVELRSIIKLMENQTSQKVANSAKFNTSISNDKFKLPDYPVQSMDEMLKQLKEDAQREEEEYQKEQEKYENSQNEEPSENLEEANEAQALDNLKDVMTPEQLEEFKKLMDSFGK